LVEVEFICRINRLTVAVRDGAHRDPTVLHPYAEADPAFAAAMGAANAAGVELSAHAFRVMPGTVQTLFLIPVEMGTPPVA